MRSQIFIFFTLALAQLLQDSQSITTPYSQDSQYKHDGFEKVEDFLSDAKYIKFTSSGTQSDVYFGPHALFERDDYWKRSHTLMKRVFGNGVPQMILSDDDLQCIKGDLPQTYKLKAKHNGHLKTSHSQKIKFSSQCFEENIISLKLHKNNSTIVIDHQTYGKRSNYCEEGFLYSDKYNHFVHTLDREGDHVIRFRDVGEDEFKYTRENGILVYSMCSKLAEFAPGFLLISMIQQGGLDLDLPYDYSQSETIDDSDWTFILDAMNHTTTKRRNPDPIDFDINLIKDGDLITSSILQKGWVFYMWMGGNHIQHVLLASWEDGQLYAVESNFDGVVKIKFDELVQTTIELEGTLGWIPLKEEYSKQLDITAANKHLEDKLGLPYGAEAVIVSALDNVFNGLAGIDVSILAPFFTITETLIPGFNIQLFPSIKHRLNMNLKKESSMYDADKLIKERGLDWAEVLAWPEQNDWGYGENFDKPSYPCPRLVVEYWQAGGLFDGIEINPVEFGARDIYQLEYLDPNPDIPYDCIDKEHGDDICVLLGKWNVKAPGLSSLKPYDHMNENCPNIPPNFERVEWC